VSRASREAQRARGIEPNYTKRARSYYNWVIAGTRMIVHMTRYVTDDFGNAVRCDDRQIEWSQRQAHDCSSFAPPGAVR
jgi:hypothetical protein